ncbi:hypothetical protein HZD82_25930, partial [Pantoea agglomerans]|nr:hypothetical protein [Pantoea agglomerans]
DGKDYLFLNMAEDPATGRLFVTDDSKGKATLIFDERTGTVTLFRLVTAWDSVKISCNCQGKIWRQALMVNHICCLPLKSPP